MDKKTIKANEYRNIEERTNRSTLFGSHQNSLRWTEGDRADLYCEKVVFNKDKGGSKAQQIWQPQEEEMMF